MADINVSVIEGKMYYLHAAGYLGTINAMIKNNIYSDTPVPTILVCMHRALSMIHGKFVKEYIGCDPPPISARPFPTNSILEILVTEPSIRSPGHKIVALAWMLKFDDINIVDALIHELENPSTSEEIFEMIEDYFEMEVEMNA